MRSKKRSMFSSCIAQRLLTSGWSGISRAPQVVLAGGGVRERGLKEILGVHALQLVRTRAPARLRGPRREGVLQRQRVSRSGESRIACVALSRTVFGMEVAEHFSRNECWLPSER